MELRPLELVAGAGPMAPAWRFGGSCVSHGTSGRNGVFAEDCFGRLGAEEGEGRDAGQPGAARSGVVKGAIVFEPPPPSDAELLAVRVARAALAGDAAEAVGGLLVDLPAGGSLSLSPPPFTFGIACCSRG